MPVFCCQIMPYVGPSRQRRSLQVSLLQQRRDVVVAIEEQLLHEQFSSCKPSEVRVGDLYRLHYPVSTILILITYVCLWHELIANCSSEFVANEQLGCLSWGRPFLVLFILTTIP